MERDIAVATKWVTKRRVILWNLHFVLNETKEDTVLCKLSFGMLRQREIKGLFGIVAPRPSHGQLSYRTCFDSVF